MRIVCVGGGPAGLYFALLMKLREPENDIMVLERNAAGSASGWGVTFGPDLLGKLYANDPQSAGEIQQAAFCQLEQVVDIHGERVPHHYDGGAYGISRKRLLAILAERVAGLGVHVEFGHEVRSAAQLPEADLIVASDGINSQMRVEAREFQTDEFVGANKYLWLGTNKAFECFTYPFIPTDNGWIWGYAYGMGDGLSTFIVECTAQAWTDLGFDAMSVEDSLPVLEKLFERHLDGHPLLVQEGQRGASAGWLNFRTVTNRPWHARNVVLMGDAAHTTHFTIGLGTTLAIEDALALADSLQQYPGDQALALESYERQRQAALLVPQSEARSGARWLENISRYADLKPREFVALLDARRSPLLPHLPRHLYYRLLQAAGKAGALGELRKRVGKQTKALSGRRATGDNIKRGSAGIRLDIPWVPEALALPSPMMVSGQRVRGRRQSRRLCRFSRQLSRTPVVTLASFGVLSELSVGPSHGSVHFLCPRDGLAHERKDRAVCGEAGGIGFAAVQGRRDARDEGGVVGEPPVHVSYPVDGEPAAGQGRNPDRLLP